jgi:hypothetical protein
MHDPGRQVFTGKLDNLHDIRPKKRFAAADIKDIGVAHGFEDLFNFIQGKFVFKPFRMLAVQLPDAACFASGLAQVGHRKSQVKRGAGGGNPQAGKPIAQHFRKNFFKITQRLFSCSNGYRVILEHFFVIKLS